MAFDHIFGTPGILWTKTGELFILPVHILAVVRWCARYLLYKPAAQGNLSLTHTNLSLSLSQPLSLSALHINLDFPFFSYAIS